MFATALAEGGSKRFSPPLTWVCLANGDADFHDNVIFFGFEEKTADPVLVAKVPRRVENGWMLKTEYDHLVELWTCIGAEAVKYVPKPYALASLQERPVLMISYVPGESLTRLPRKSFWVDSKQVSALASEAARTLRHLNQLTETPIEQNEIVHFDFHPKADKFKELFQLSAEEDRALAELVQRVNDGSNQASHKVLIQGDFWHGNMIRGEARGSLMFVDWQFARWSADVSADIYFFLLAGALGAARDGTVTERARLAYQLLCDWRADVIPAYLTSYGTPEHYVLLPQKYGMLLCCVEKAVRSALEFGYRHPDDLMWRSLFRELLQWPEEGSSNQFELRDA